jgi:hypothetical protein
MSTNIDEVILFIHTDTANCVPCVRFVMEYKLPVKIVRLDDPYIREKARNGQYFSITMVPSMVVTYVDGNIQLFVGRDKILTWLNSVVLQASQRSPETGPTNPPYGNEPHPTAMKVYSQPPKGANAYGTRQPPRVIDTTEEDEPEDIPTKKKKSPKKKKGNKKKVTFDPRRNREAPQGDDESAGVEYINKPPPLPTKGLIVGNENANSSKKGMKKLMMAAKEMEKQRDATLGYREEDLPVANF